MTRQTFLALLAIFDCTLDTDCEECCLNVDAPRGKIFKATGTHCISVPWNNNGGQSWKPEAYVEAADLVAHGLIECEGVDCDVCNPEE